MTLQTIGDARKLIRKAKAVYIRPFFGTVERWVKISRLESRRYNLPISNGERQ